MVPAAWLTSSVRSRPLTLPYPLTAAPAALMMPSCAQSNESSRYMGLDLPSLVDPITYPKADMAAPASIDSFGNDVIATCSSSFSVLLPASSTWEYNDCARMISADSSDNLAAMAPSALAWASHCSTSWSYGSSM